MRVTCPHCGQAGKITTTKYLNEARTVADLYAECSNTQGCGARFVYSLGHTRTIQGPTRTTQERAEALLRGLTPEQRDILRRQIQQ